MTLTTMPFNSHLDLPAYRGQRVERFRFEWKNGLTGETLGYITPERGSPPSLSHDTQQSLKRRLTLSLGVQDTTRINPITDRILPWMIVGGVTYPLGRYMFSDETDLQSTRGDRGTFTLFDEGFIIEQELSESFSSSSSVNEAVFDLLTGLPLVGISVEATPFPAVGAFTVGTNRSQVLEAYATQGDFFPYWMDHTGEFRMIRTKDPATAVVDLDFDAGFKVQRDSISRVNDVLTASNRFVVISNSGDTDAGPVVGVYDVPPTAPHSIAKRGFVIQSSEYLQIASNEQATAMARNLGIRRTIYERVTLNTAIDPRHDSYNIVRFGGVNWLELAWQMALTPGGTMTHTMRKAYL